MKGMNVLKTLFLVVVTVLIFGCASTGKPIQRIVKPIEKASDEIGKTRTLGKDQTYAVLAPREDKKLSIPF